MFLVLFLLVLICLPLALVTRGTSRAVPRLIIVSLGMKILAIPALLAFALLIINARWGMPKLAVLRFPLTFPLQVISTYRPCIGRGPARGLTRGTS